MEHEFHRTLKARATEWAILQYKTALQEFQLPNGKIADVISAPQNHNIVIIEVKTILDNQKLTSTIDKYKAYCNNLWLGLPEAAAQHLNEYTNSLNIHKFTRDFGILALGDRYAYPVRPAPYRRLPDLTDNFLHWQYAQRSTTIATPIEGSPNLPTGLDAEAQ